MDSSDFDDEIEFPGRDSSEASGSDDSDHDHEAQQHSHGMKTRGANSEEGGRRLRHHSSTEEAPFNGNGPMSPRTRANLAKHRNSGDAEDDEVSFK